MTLELIELETGPNPTASVIWLHGLGADGHDFTPVVPHLGIESTRVGPVRFVFPHAPMIPVTINGGYVMRAWYDILGADLVRREDEAGLRKSQADIEALIAREVAAGIDSSRIVLAGFSQGCAMALLTGLRHARRLAGLIGLSGYLPLAGQLNQERSAANARTPLFLGHGIQDPIVPLARAQAAFSQLQALDYPVEWHDYHMEHSVCLEEIADIGAFLNRVLG